MEDLASSAAVGGALEAAHHEVRTCSGWQVLPQHVATYRPDLVVAQLPDGDPGLARAMVRRTHASYRPLLLCCASDAQGPVAALESGADACLSAPWTVGDVELHARVLLRRAPWLARPLHHVGDLVVDEDAHVALYGDEPLGLSAKEFALLAMLAHHQGTVLSKRRLLEALWGYDAVDENLVEVHVSALRRRLPAEARHLVQTVRGVGYVLRDDSAQARLA